MLINSVNGDEVLGQLTAGRHTDLVARCACSNTAPAHRHRRDNRRRGRRLQAAGLLATRFTIEADLFGPALASRGITVVTPTADEQETVDRVYFDELVAGQFPAFNPLIAEPLPTSARRPMVNQAKFAPCGAREWHQAQGRTQRAP